ncbi:MAG: hypothetical protein LBN37_03675 [Bacteroidales bacterium]|jgi:hypothetical protein|nr:hypothetical protein [Bacteroidales bacterium]
MKRIIICLLLAGYAGAVSAAENDELTVPKDSTNKDYRKVLMLKVNKGKGYRKQAFELEDTYALLEKGVSYLSFNVGFQSNDIDDYWFEPLAVVDEIYRRNASGSLALGYFIKNNMSVGVKGSYSFSDTRVRIEADLFDLLFSAQTYETNNVSSTYSAAGVLKNYVPLNWAHRLFIVNETNLSFSHSHSLAKNIYDNGVKINKIEKEKFSVGLGISPGFMYFMTKGLAFEFSLNPVLIYFEKTDITNNLTDKGEVNNYGLSFKFMPLNVQFGFSYYFGLDYFKNKEHIDLEMRRR